MTSVSRIKIAATALALAASALAVPARAADAGDEAFYQRAADCAAAMQVDQLEMATRLRDGDAAVRPALFDLTKLGFAYVGQAYLKGLRDPRGADMLKAAGAAQKDWPAARHRALVAECRAEAQPIYDNSGMWKLLVDRKANQRIDRFLAAGRPPASAASAP